MLSGFGSSLKSALAPVASKPSTPKATFVKGTQIAMPTAANYEIPTQNYQSPALNQTAMQLIQEAAAGGIIHKASGGDLPMQQVRMRGRQFAHHSPYGGLGLISSAFAPIGKANGGEVEGHNPTFFSVGGLNSMENTYVKGEGDGTSDSVAAMLANGEFVIPADVVSKLGNGSNDAGAQVLDNFLVTIREHAQKHDPKDLPPKSKGPLAYLLDAKKKVKA